jgi:AraC-like DNA-binding protein
MAHSPFVLVATLEPMLATCTDHITVRRTFAFWQSRHRAHGTVMWGRPSEDDVVAMCDLWDAHMRSPFAADPTLTDIRGLESVDLLAFERLIRTFAERNAAWSARTGSQAILHAGGLPAAAILGALQLAAKGYRLGAFDSSDAALAWLGVPALAPEYDAMRESLLDVPDIVRRVRTALAGEPRTPSPAALARTLGLSLRSLQRHLESAGTSLRSERLRHLVLRAERLLEGTDLDLDAIAAMIGAGTGSRLVALFRSVRGTTPGAFRRERAPTVSGTSRRAG